MTDIDLRVLTRKVVSDQNRLRQIFVNLLSNGIKYTTEGYVKLSAEVLNDETIAFRVEDSGVGI